MSREEIRFPARFLAWSLGLWLLAVWGFFSPSVGALRSGTVLLVVGGSRLTGLSAEPSASGVVAFGGGSFHYWVTDACTAWGAALLYASAVLAYPASWRLRARGLAVGLPLVFALNVVRLVSMAWLGFLWPARFEEVHGFWWQGFVILAIGLGWLAWARNAEAQRRGSATAGRWKELGVAVVVFASVLAGAAVLGASTQAVLWYGAFIVGPVRGRVRLFRRDVRCHAPGPRLGLLVLLRRVGGGRRVVPLHAPHPGRAEARGGRRDWRARVLLDIFTMGVWHLVLAREVGRASATYLFAQILAMAGTVVVWFVCARRTWVMTGPSRPSQIRPPMGLRGFHGIQA